MHFCRPQSDTKDVLVITILILKHITHVYTEKKEGNRMRGRRQEIFTTRTNDDRFVDNPAGHFYAFCFKPQYT